MKQSPIFGRGCRLFVPLTPITLFCGVVLNLASRRPSSGCALSPKVKAGCRNSH